MVNGKKIRELREAKNLTVNEFAEIVYVSHTMIIRVEMGHKPPSVALLERIADYFNCTVNELLIPDENVV